MNKPNATEMLDELLSKQFRTYHGSFLKVAPHLMSAAVTWMEKYGDGPTTAISKGSRKTLRRYASSHYEMVDNIENITPEMFKKLHKTKEGIAKVVSTYASHMLNYKKEEAPSPIGWAALIKFMQINEIEISTVVVLMCEKMAKIR
jgi:hypothetical protein